MTNVRKIQHPLESGLTHHIFGQLYTDFDKAYKYIIYIHIL